MVERAGRPTASVPDHRRSRQRLRWAFAILAVGTLLAALPQNRQVVGATPCPAFGPATTLPTGGTAPVSVAIGDLNGDGRPDLAVANSGSNTVGVLLASPCDPTEPTPTPTTTPTATATATPTPTRPTAPSNVHVGTVTSSSIQVQWTDTSANERGFQVAYRPVAGGTWATREVGANRTAVTVGGLSPGTSYVFGVRACNAAGCSAWAGPAFGSTLPAAGATGATSPAAPRGTAVVSAWPPDPRIAWPGGP